MTVFADRREAGHRLGEALAALDLADPVVCALPRGGVPIGAEVADALGAPLDIIGVRKLGAPGHRELAVGAIGEGGARVLNETLIASILETEAEIEAEARRQETELERQVHEFRGSREPIPLARRTAIVTDDGLATGATARVAAEVVRKRGAATSVLAVPVGPPDTVRELGLLYDRVVCLRQPHDLHAVGLWYRDFSQVPDSTVRRLLDEKRPAS